jgi:hypothetical protein
MENTTDLQTRKSNNANKEIKHLDREKSAYGISGFFPAIVNLIAEDGDNFFRYLKTLGLTREKNLVVLSSRRHYYYDEEEMKNVKTLINLKKLNLIKYLDEFLYTLVNILPENSNILGCFNDCNTELKNGVSILHPIKMLRHRINILDLRIERTLNKKIVSDILMAHGFKISDITEMNGITYFCAQKCRKAAVMRA